MKLIEKAIARAREIDPVVIKFPSGAEGLVDAEDWEWLSKYTWSTGAIQKGVPANSYARKCYARTHIRKPDGKTSAVSMHRLIMNAPADRQVDHKNGNSLDNRRSNLRLCGARENQANRIRPPGLSSQYRGVTKPKNTKNWRAMISTGGKATCLGLHASEALAALEYDIAAIDAYGEFARPNFPRDLVAHIVELRRAVQPRDLRIPMTDLELSWLKAKIEEHFK